MQLVRVRSRCLCLSTFCIGSLWLFILLHISLLGDFVKRIDDSYSQEILTLNELRLSEPRNGMTVDRVNNHSRTMSTLMTTSSGNTKAQTKMIDAFTAKITTEFVLNTNIEERAESLINAGTGLHITAQTKCDLAADDDIEYPSCKSKTDWMRSLWQSDSCYASNGVDGSDCSIRIYLSEVEHFCPPLPERVKQLLDQTSSRSSFEHAQMGFNLSGLLELLKGTGSNRNNYEWIRARVTRLWPKWVTAGQTLSQKQDMSGRQAKRILIHLGLLSAFNFVETSDKGGPLGELVQWSDIISTLYLLGHSLTIVSEIQRLTTTLSKFPSKDSPCQSRQNLPLDLIFTDIVGLIQMKKLVHEGFGKFSCLLRVIDTFGTEAEFNLESYAQKNGRNTPWGMHNLNLQQFYTMFPHSPDNSFMGFVVEQYLNSSNREEIMKGKKDQAVVYGKAEFMWQGKVPYLEVISKHMSIHSTVFIDSNNLPSFVTNHGILKSPDMQQLLRESKLFIGLGFPYEGPAPLEAIAQGCVFINPSFRPPHSSQNTEFFHNKPTRRELSNQHPYVAEFIGEPSAFSVNMGNLTEVDEVVTRALKAFNDGRVKPFLPYEFTEEGMLQRVNAYLEHQNFCKSTVPNKRWPLNTTTVVGEAGVSCKIACQDKGLMCEPSHFKYLNTPSALRQYAPNKCATISKAANIVNPAFDVVSSNCVQQEQVMLFSCVGERPSTRRLCPCRTFKKEQTALCAECF